MEFSALGVHITLKLEIPARLAGDLRSRTVAENTWSWLPSLLSEIIIILVEPDQQLSLGRRKISSRSMVS
jgi:hypothetical protein